MWLGYLGHLLKLAELYFKNSDIQNPIGSLQPYLVALFGKSLADEVIGIVGLDGVTKASSATGVQVYTMVICCARHHSRSALQRHERGGFYMVREIETSNRIHSTSCSCEKCRISPQGLDGDEWEFNEDGLLMCQHQLAALIAESTYSTKVNHDKQCGHNILNK